MHELVEHMLKGESGAVKAQLTQQRVMQYKLRVGLF